MRLEIIPKKLDGSVCAQPSKSYMHRFLLCDALAGRSPAELLSGYGDSVSCDVRETAAALEVLCAETADDARRVFDIRESGSTLRFLMPVAAALGFDAEFRCGESLAARPMDALMTALSNGGCTVRKTGNSYELSGKLRAGEYCVRGDISSQFVSGLLFALPLLDGDSTLVVSKPLLSKPYVEMTLDCIAVYGPYITEEETASSFIYRIEGNSGYEKRFEIKPEGDWSSASVLLAAGAASGGQVTVTGLDESSHQGDKAIAEFVKRGTEPFVCDISDTPDLAPALLILALAANGESVISGCERLKYKETDRLRTLTDALRAIGADISVSENAITVRGTGKLAGGAASSMHDHRVAMALAGASVLCSGPVIIDCAEAVDKSYPDFFKDFVSLGGVIHEL